MTAVGKLVLVLGLLVSAQCEVRARDPEVEEEEEEEVEEGAGTGGGRGATPPPSHTTEAPTQGERARSGHQSSTRPLYTQKILTVLRWSCCKGHEGADRDDADPDAQLELEGSDASGGSDPEKQGLRPGPARPVEEDVHVGPDRKQNDQHWSKHGEATAALPVPHMMALVMSQLQPVLEAFNRSLDHLSRQVKALAGDVAELKSSWAEPDLQPGPPDQAAEQHETRLEGVLRQITDIRKQMETQQTDMEDRLNSQHATLHHNVTSLKMDTDLKLERHQKDVQVSLRAMNATLYELKLDQDQDQDRSSTEPPPQQQLADSAALWEAIERLDNAVVNNTGKVSGLMEDVDVASGDVQRLQRHLKELREQMEQTGRNTQIQYMMTGLQVEDAKVAVLQRVGELAANLTLQDKRLQEMDMDVDDLYVALYNSSSIRDTNALKAALARLEKALANVAALAHDNRLALEESSKEDVEQWSVPAVEALQHGLQQVKDCLVSEQSRTRSLNHSLAQLSGSVTAGLAEVSGLKDANRELWEKMQHLSTWFKALLTDASRHSEVLDILLGEEVLEFMQWPRQDQRARSIPALMQQLAEHKLKITSLLANKTGGTEERPSADQPSSSHPPLPGWARERQLLLHPDQEGAGRELQNLEKMVEKMWERLNQEEKPCRCTNASTVALPAGVDAALQAEVLWLKRGLEHHLSTFKNVFSNADVLARSNNTLELDKLWDLVKSKDKRRRGGNRSRRDSDVPPAELADPLVQFVAVPPQSTSHSGFSFKLKAKPSLNQGRFHPETGSFTAPVDGLYLFILTLDLKPGPTQVVLRRRSGGSPVSLYQAEVVEAGPRTGVGLLLLQAGEEVRLDLRRGLWLENQDNVFTGLLLHRTT